MSNPFFDRPILNSPYECPQQPRSAWDKRLLSKVHRALRRLQSPLQDEEKFRPAGPLPFRGRLVALVERFDRVLEMALLDVDSCSNDPLCEEAAEAGAPGSACYSCMLVSETSCEHRNLCLDRLLLVENAP